MQLSEKYKYNKLQIMLWAQLQILRVVLDYWILCTKNQKSFQRMEPKQAIENFKSKV